MLLLWQSYSIFLSLCRKSTAKTTFILLFCAFLKKKKTTQLTATLLRGFSPKDFEEQLCEMKSPHGFDVPWSICLGPCFHHNCRRESRKREREWQSITGYIARCVVWKNCQKAAIEVAAENELSAVILFIQHVSLPEAVYFKAFKVLCTKGGFPSCCLIVRKGWKHPANFTVFLEKIILDNH